MLLATLSMVLSGPLHAQSATQLDSRPAVAQPTSAPASDPNPRDWRLQRGDIAHSGVSGAQLSERLRLAWRVQLGEAIVAGALIADGVVFAATEEGKLFALKAQDGGKLWEYAAGEPLISPPALAGGLLLVGDEAGTLHALSAADGALRWKYETKGKIASGPNIAEGVALFGSYDGFVYALSVADGALRWKYETPDRVHGAPAIAGDHVLLAGCDGYLHVVRRADGSPTRQIEAGVSGSCAAVAGDVAFLGTQGGQVLGIDWRKGQLLWRYEDIERQFPYTASAALAGELVVVAGRDKHVRALERTSGTQRWSFATRGRIDSSPVVVGQRVFVGSGDGNLYELDLRSGALRWRFECGAAVSASPALADDLLVVGAEDGVLYAFRGE